jgi:DNA helicase-2/ATP-dependent DNA helicase PcrA
MKLLEVFFTHITTDKSFLSNEEKYMLIVDVLSNNALKQSMEYLDENIIITTVHSAKGLEWDYVIIPDMERNSFPNYMSLCSSCSEQSNNDACKTCYISKKTKSLDKYMEVLSIFYVAVTRARKQVFFSGSLESKNDVRYPNTKYSCLLSLLGIKLVQDTP